MVKIKNKEKAVLLRLMLIVVFYFLGIEFSKIFFK